MVSAIAENPGLKLGVNVVGGQVTYRPVADAVGVPYVPVEEALSGAVTAG
jgi:alanine dehydrogenase